MEYWEQTQAHGEPVRRHFPSTTVSGLPRLNMYHPDLQEAVLQVASDAGAVVHRGARVRGIEPGEPQNVIATLNGRD